MERKTNFNGELNSSTPFERGVIIVLSHSDPSLIFNATLMQ
jgi:hypothetical protein